MAWCGAHVLGEGKREDQAGTLLWRSFFVMLKVKVKVAQSCPTLCDPMDYTVHGILQARILGWVARPFSSESSQPRNRTGVSCIVGGFFTDWAIPKWMNEWMLWGHFEYGTRFTKSVLNVKLRILLKKEPGNCWDSNERAFVLSIVVLKKDVWSLVRFSGREQGSCRCLLL